MFFLIALFLIIILSGFVIVRTITKETDSFILLPVSQIVGAIFYIFLLNLVSKIFPGLAGISISTIGLIFLTALVFLKYKSGWIKLSPLSSNNKFLVLLIISVILILSILRMFTVLPAADSSMQWAYAASFARGNQPLMTSWQPDLTPNYHLGAYFLEGALYRLTGATFLLIHTIFNIYLLLAGSLMVIFLLWKKGGNYTKIWAIVSVIIFFISYGVIIVALPNFSSQPQLVEIYKLKDFVLAKGDAGASLIDLNSLSYLPARSLSIGFALTLLYFMSTPFKKNLLKIISLSILLSISALVEESLFLPLMLTVVSIFILSLFSFIPKLEYIAKIRKLLFVVIMLTTVIVIFQGGFVTDNMFGAKRESQAYRIVNPLAGEDAFISTNIFKDIYFKSNLWFPFSGWFVPSPLWFILILVIYSYIKKEPFTGSTALFAAVCFTLFLTAQYKYCTQCNIRLHSFGYIALGFGIFYLIIDLLKKTSKKKNLISLVLFIVFILIPTISSDLYYQDKNINEGIREKKPSIILSPRNSIPDEIGIWARDNIPPNERIIVLDAGFPSPGGSLNFQYHGLYTILGPQYVRVNRQEPGMEFFDLALTLNPSLLTKTKTRYVYIESSSPAYKQLPDFRKQELNNPNFFQILKRLESNGVFYEILQVLPQYLNESIGGKEINEGRLDQLKTLVPKESSVYLSDYGDTPELLSFWYRMATTFSLGEHNLVMNLSQTTYQVIETEFTRRQVQEGEVYDYYVLGPGKKLDFNAELIWSNMFASAWKRI
ncbi:hypothetical protein HYW43_00050 [Candidatus Daviesbacteria bacterium]|nr:hypothetical protein [Candidatus Daviesbacteria bacterium]